MVKSNLQIENITSEILLENSYIIYVETRLREQKEEFLNRRKVNGEKWFDDLKKKYKKLTEKERSELPNEENYLFYYDKTWEDIIKNEYTRILKSTREFFRIAKNPAFIQMFDNGQALISKLVKIILRQKDFATKLFDDNYKVALLEESENGTLEINGKKYIIHE